MQHDCDDLPFRVGFERELRVNDLGEEDGRDNSQDPTPNSQSSVGFGWELGIGNFLRETTVGRQSLQHQSASPASTQLTQLPRLACRTFNGDLELMALLLVACCDLLAELRKQRGEPGRYGDALVPSAGRLGYRQTNLCLIGAAGR